MQYLRKFVGKQESSSTKNLSEIQPTCLKSTLSSIRIVLVKFWAVLLHKDEFDVTEYIEREEKCDFSTAFSVRRKFWAFFLKVRLYFNYSILM